MGESRAHREADALVGRQGHVLARADRLDCARGNRAQLPGAKADEAHLLPACQILRVHGKDKACSLPFRCFARCCAHEAMLHNRAGLCQGSLSPAGYVPAWHVGAGSAQRHLLAARRAPQVPLPSTRAVLATQLGTSVVKVGILSTIEQASLPKKVRYEHNQRGPCCSYSLATCLASRRGSISTWCLHLTQAPSMFPHRDIHSGRLTASRI